MGFFSGGTFFEEGDFFGGLAHANPGRHKQKVITNPSFGFGTFYSPFCWGICCAEVSEILELQKLGGITRAVMLGHMGKEGERWSRQLAAILRTTSTLGRY